MSILHQMKPFKSFANFSEFTNKFSRRAFPRFWRKAVKRVLKNNSRWVKKGQNTKLVFKSSTLKKLQWTNKYFKTRTSNDTLCNMCIKSGTLLQNSHGNQIFDFRTVAFSYDTFYTVTSDNKTRQFFSLVSITSSFEIHR